MVETLPREAVKQQTATPRAATIEAEHKLIQVGLEAGLADGPLQGAKEPALEQ